MVGRAIGFLTQSSPHLLMNRMVGDVYFKKDSFISSERRLVRVLKSALVEGGTRLALLVLATPLAGYYAGKHLATFVTLLPVSATRAVFGQITVGRDKRKLISFFPKTCEKKEMTDRLSKALFFALWTLPSSLVGFASPKTLYEQYKRLGLAGKVAERIIKKPSPPVSNKQPAKEESPSVKTISKPLSKKEIEGSQQTQEEKSSGVQKERTVCCAGRTPCRHRGVVEQFLKQQNDPKSWGNISADTSIQLPKNPFELSTASPSIFSTAGFSPIPYRAYRKGRGCSHEKKPTLDGASTEDKHTLKNNTASVTPSKVKPGQDYRAVEEGGKLKFIELISFGGTSSTDRPVGQILPKNDLIPPAPPAPPLPSVGVSMAQQLLDPRLGYKLFSSLPFCSTGSSSDAAVAPPASTNSEKTGSLPFTEAFRQQTLRKVPENKRGSRKGVRPEDKVVEDDSSRDNTFMRGLKHIRDVVEEDSNDSSTNNTSSWST